MLRLQISPSVRNSWTLPADVYLDPALLERERQHLFGKSWQIVGRRHQVTNPGDYFTVELAGEPLLIVRGSDGAPMPEEVVAQYDNAPAGEGVLVYRPEA